MTGTKLTSTGHAVADAPWLDNHFQSARAGYEDCLRSVGIMEGWTVLDAGCGGGNFLPLICELVGSDGAVIAIDLAPENVARVETLCRERVLRRVQTHVASVMSLPFDNATFDCVWSANVVQYLTEPEFDCAVAEFKRVLKPGGILAIKEHDTTIGHLLPMDPGTMARLVSARRSKSNVLGPWCGSSMPSRLRKAGLAEVTRRGWLVERWAPMAPYTRALFADGIRYFAGLAAKHDIPARDLQAWQDAARDPESLLNDPDCCLREFFVLTARRVVTREASSSQ